MNSIWLLHFLYLILGYINISTVFFVIVLTVLELPTYVCMSIANNDKERHYLNMSLHIGILLVLITLVLFNGIFLPSLFDVTVLLDPDSAQASFRQS